MRKSIRKRETQSKKVEQSKKAYFELTFDLSTIS